ncbi:uncharacterized protein METZ01_LOCUS413884, partial [marine metagenome]
MKRLLLLLFIAFVSFQGFSQIDLNIDKSITIKEEKIDENYTPFKYISNGVYEIFYENGYSSRALDRGIIEKKELS